MPRLESSLNQVHKPDFRSGFHCPVIQRPNLLEQWLLQFRFMKTLDASMSLPLVEDAR